MSTVSNWQCYRWWQSRISEMLKLCESVEPRTDIYLWNIYQSDNNPKWTVEIWIGADTLFQVIHRRTSWNNCRLYALRHYVRVNVEKFLIKFNTEYGMHRLWTIVSVDTLTCSNVKRRQQLPTHCGIWFRSAFTYLLRWTAVVYLRCAKHWRWHSSNRLNLAADHWPLSWHCHTATFGVTENSR